MLNGQNPVLLFIFYGIEMFSKLRFIVSLCLNPNLKLGTKAIKIVTVELYLQLNSST